MPSPSAADTSVESVVFPDVAMHQGLLGIQHDGKVMKKFFVLYADRLDYFHSAVDAISAQEPLGRMVLAEVGGHEVFGVGLILDILGRKVGLKADHEADVRDWDAHLKVAMAGVRRQGSSTASGYNKSVCSTASDYNSRSK